MSNTPRTDKFLASKCVKDETYTTFARELEKELYTMQEDRDRMVGYINADREEFAKWKNERDEQIIALAKERDLYLSQITELKQIILEQTNHGIPFYAYGDNEAGCEFSNRLSYIHDAVNSI
jgi:hypothetical protein